jgi:hypothetical protein
MVVLGMDPSLTNFGWVIYDTDKEPEHCVKRGRFQTKSKDLFVLRYMQMRDSVEALIRDNNIVRVGIEHPIFNDLWSEGMYGLFLYTCEALWNSGVSVVFFSPGQIKAHARQQQVPKTLPDNTVVLKPIRAGNWKMEKQDMVEAAFFSEGQNGKRMNHNEADAYWIAKTSSRFWMLHDGLLTIKDLNDVERKQFVGVQVYQRGKNKGKIEAKGILHREDEKFFCWKD